MLNLSPVKIIESLNKEYLDTLNSQEKVKYINSIKESTSVYLDAQIAEMEGIYNSVKTTLNNTLQSAATWAIQIPLIATPEPAAPKTGAATLVSLKNSVSQAKAQVESAASQLEQLKMGLSLWRMEDSSVSNLFTLLSEVRNALNLIPL